MVLWCSGVSGCRNSVKAVHGAVDDAYAVRGVGELAAEPRLGSERLLL